MEILEYWKIVRKRLWLILFLMILGGAAATYYTSQQVPLYRTTTTLFINPRQISPLLPSEFVRVSMQSEVQSLANTYAELLRTRSFIQRVAEQMEADVSSGEIAGAVSSQYVADTQFFRISATHPDPVIAQQIANTAAEVLIAREVSRQQTEQELIEAQRNPDISREKEQLNTLIDSLVLEVDYYDAEIANVEEEINNLQNRPGFDVNEQRLEILRTRLPELRYARIDVQTRLADAQARKSNLTVSTTPPVGTAVVVDEALVPTTPIPSQATQRIILAVLVSMASGIGIAFLLEYLDYTIKTPESLDAIYNLPVQAVIGSLDQKFVKRVDEPLLATQESRSPIAESFRSFRTAIQVARLNKPLRSILVTSAGPGEGKTFVAANLAASLAMSGNRVILVDTDLRKPRLHHMFNLPRGVGFTNLMISSETEITDVLQNTQIKNLKVLTCGTVPPNPSELLETGRAEMLMHNIQEHADIVIYDSPPAATVTDAVILGRRVDAVIQVVWAGHTNINLVLRCRDVLTRAGANVLGPVLNKVTLSDLGYYSYYYNYGYYREDSKPAKKSFVGRLLGRKEKPVVSKPLVVRNNIIDQTNTNTLSDSHGTNGSQVDISER